MIRTDCLSEIHSNRESVMHCFRDIKAISVEKNENYPVPVDDVTVVISLS